MEDQQESRTPYNEEADGRDGHPDAVGSVQAIFKNDYMPTKKSPIMPSLPEEAPISAVEYPTIEISMDNSSSPEEVRSASGQTSTGLSLAGETLQTPRARRRSSAAGHRRRSSTRSNGTQGGASPEIRRLSSFTSATSRGESVDLQADGGDSEFGDFDDFEEGDFVDGEAFSDEADEELIQADSLEQGLNRLPDINDETEVLAYMKSSLADMFPSGLLSDTIKAPKNVPDGTLPLTESDEEDDSPYMLTDRAVSLWKQLTAPPPLQPPDWKRSRIRRLFLVSLGIPVDLDEILPKMTHKKLVLPSTRRHKDKKQDERSSRKKIPPPPEFEISSARQFCTTTREALSSMTTRELEIHTLTLKAHTATASGLLTYWLEQRESAQSEKDTFEQVVSNLVQYHKKQKDEQKESVASGAKKSKLRFSMRG